MLLLYTAVFVAIFGLLQFVPLTLFPSVDVWGQLGIWCLLYAGGYLVARLVSTSVLRVWGDNEQVRQWRATGALLRPPYLGWVDALVEIALIAVFALAAATALREPVIPRLTLAFAAGIVLLACSIVIAQNWKAVYFPGRVVDAVAYAGPLAREITLRWRNPPDPGFAGVLLLRSEDESELQRRVGQEVYAGFQEQFVDEECVPGVAYHYAAFSRSAQGALAGRAPLSASAFPLPPNVVDLDFTAGEHEIRLSWRLPDSSSSESIREVIVTRRTDGIPEGGRDGVCVYQGTQEYAYDTNLDIATRYYYRVTTVDRWGQQSRGKGLEAATRAPAARALRSTLVDEGVRLEWTLPSTASSTVRVMRRQGLEPPGVNEGVIVYEGEERECIDDDTLPATTYCYAVFTRYPRDVYGNPKIARIVTPPPAPPIEDLTVDAQQTTVLLRWRNPASQRFAGVYIQRASERPALTVAQAGSVFVYQGDDQEAAADFGLEADTEYHYSAFSYDLAGRYSPALVIAVRTPSALVAPSAGGDDGDAQ